jgi:hypothetical protein
MGLWGLKVWLWGHQQATTQLAMVEQFQRSDK